MNINVKQLSSLIKVRSQHDFSANALKSCTLFAGESFSYQIGIDSEDILMLTFDVESELKDHITLYSVQDTIMDFAISSTCTDDDFLTKEPGIMPDLLLPADTHKNFIRKRNKPVSIWVKIDVPKSYMPGHYPVAIKIKAKNGLIDEPELEITCTMNVNVMNCCIPEQKTIFTQWFHTDCIASAHNVEIYSEKHWALIDKYMQLASDLGINMLLTPTFTPALDTEPGLRRPDVQLIKITCKNDVYSFDFTLLKRWIDLCHNHNIKYFEIAHLFSQWGAGFTPNIAVFENGKKEYKFGWHTEASSPAYKQFLEQYLPSLISFLESENILDKCYFHISDEPTAEHLEAYRYAHSIVKPLIKDCRLMDAISDKEFYDTGLMDIPVTASNRITPFLKDNIENQWVYYCCGQFEKVGNRFLSMPSYRNRILGVQMYKYDISGFLQWGYNFYYSALSKYEINPYITSSADKAFPSGDAFSVYPAKDGAYPSLRGVIFKEALQDIEICRLLEKYIGKDAVVDIIDSYAGMNITFEDYPRNDDFIPSLMNKIKEEIKKYI